MALIPGMDNDKICAKCGTSERYAAGDCKKCRADSKRRYRARVRGDEPPVGKTTARVHSHTPAIVLAIAEGDPVNLAESLSSGKARLAFMLDRHENTLVALDVEALRLDQCLADAETMADKRFYTSEKRKLLEARISYDQRLSKDFQAYQELVAKDDTETPITFVHVGLPPREWVETGCVGDTMDFSDYMPEKMGDAPPVKA